MNLPPDFISIITNTFGEDGEDLISNLPALIEETSQRWGLTNIQPVSNLSYNFVAFGKRDNMEVVLKVGVPRDELTSEIAALRLFNGEGAYQLIDADEEKGFLLLERLKSGVMHGDFHHFNILSSARGWLVIDPKGVIGPAGYEVGPLMINPWGSLPDGINFQLRMKRRIDILHEHLGFERERIHEWSLAHTILSAWWGIEDNTGWEYAMDFARMIADLK
jgi:streptomycin 6-kinase